jgi:hypothetical protein
MKRPLALGLILFSWVYAQPTPTPTPNPPQPTPTPTQPTPAQSMPAPSPTPPPTVSANPNPNPMPPIELKPEDRKFIELKKDTMLKQTYNEYQKVDKATSIDKVNLERSLLEAKQALKVQQYKNKQLEVQMSYLYYYNIPISGVVGNMAITNGMVLKDGTVLMGNDKIVVQNGHVYVGGYLVSYPVMDNIKYPQVGTTSVSSPQLLTGMPSFGGGGGSPVGTPPLPPPPPPPR